MREIRPSGLEGGETQLNASSLPLSMGGWSDVCHPPLAIPIGYLALSLT
jgi:hypothetical protein